MTGLTLDGSGLSLIGSTGTVTTLSVASANGFAGSVANATTTPAITISTTINSPLLAGNGTAIAAATTTGTGSTAVLSAAPTLTGIPILGAPTATSLALGGATIGANALAVTGTSLFTGAITGTTTIATGAPAGSTAGLWKLGALETAVVTPDTTRYVALDIGGVVYKLIVST